MLFLAIMPTVLLVAYGQLIIKWRIEALQTAYADTSTMQKLLAYAIDPVFISAYAAALLGSFAWIFVVSRHDISVAFPMYIGAVVILVTMGGMVFFNEPINLHKMLAFGLIITGVVLVSRA